MTHKTNVLFRYLGIAAKRLMCPGVVHDRKRSLMPGEALAGAKVRVATVSGDVELAVPKGSNTGTILRLRRKGVTSAGGNGDHLVELQVMLPDHPDEELVRCITEWEAKHAFDPRKRQGAQI